MPDPTFDPVDLRALTDALGAASATLKADLGALQGAKASTRTSRRERADSGVEGDVAVATSAFRVLGDSIQGLARASGPSSASLRALARDGLELLGVESSKTRKLVADLIATLSRLGLNTPAGFASATRGGGGGGFLDAISGPFEDLFSFGAPGRSEAVVAPEPQKIELHFHSVVADRRSLDRHVREEIEPRLRALTARRTPASL